VAGSRPWAKRLTCRFACYLRDSLTAAVASDWATGSEFTYSVRAQMAALTDVRSRENEVDGKVLPRGISPLSCNLHMA